MATRDLVESPSDVAIKNWKPCLDGNLVAPSRGRQMEMEEIIGRNLTAAGGAFDQQTHNIFGRQVSLQLSKRF